MRNGGQAFPLFEPAEEGICAASSTPGMSLRDYFAAAALQGLVCEYGQTVEYHAMRSYEYADAMLLEREKRP